MNALQVEHGPRPSRMRDELRDGQVEVGLHELRGSRGAESEVQALEPLQPADGRPQVQGVGRERHAEDDRVALGHHDAGRGDRALPRLREEHLVVRRVLVGEEVEVVLPGLDGGHAVLEADDLRPARQAAGQFLHRRHVHADLAALAVAHDRVGVRGILRQHERGVDELRHVARAADAGGEHDLVLACGPAHHVPVDADARVAVRGVGGPALGDARIVEGAAVVVPRQLRVEARVRDGHARIARVLHLQHPKRRVLGAAGGNAVGHEPAIGRGDEPVYRGAPLARAWTGRRVDEHALRARESVAHAQHRGGSARERASGRTPCRRRARGRAP